MYDGGGDEETAREEEEEKEAAAAAAGWHQKTRTPHRDVGNYQQYGIKKSFRFHDMSDMSMILASMRCSSGTLAQELNSTVLEAPSRPRPRFNLRSLNNFIGLKGT